MEPLTSKSITISLPPDDARKYDGRSVMSTLQVAVPAGLQIGNPGYTRATPELCVMESNAETLLVVFVANVVSCSSYGFREQRKLVTASLV